MISVFVQPITRQSGVPVAPQHDDDSVAANHQDSVKNPLAALDAFLNRACFDAADPGALGEMLKQMVDCRI